MIRHSVFTVEDVTFYFDLEPSLLQVSIHDTTSNGRFERTLLKTDPIFTKNKAFDSIRKLYDYLGSIFVENQGDAVSIESFTKCAFRLTPRDPTQKWVLIIPYVCQLNEDNGKRSKPEEIDNDHSDDDNDEIHF